MGISYSSVVDCVRNAHDVSTLGLAALVCAAGIYAGLALATHALRATGTARTRWGLVAVTASGCTAWATHFIALLAFNPGMPAAFEPITTAVSMLCGIVGIGAGVGTALRYTSRPGRFVGGVLVGLGITFLHYVGQSAYAVQGIVVWNLGLIAISTLLGVSLSGLSMLVAANHNRHTRRLAPVLLLLSIAAIHFCGMAALEIRFDPTVALPPHAISPQAIAPVLAGLSLALLALAVIGLHFDLAAQARLRRQRQRLRALVDVTFEGLLICQGEVIVTANASAERVSGHDAAELMGTPVSALLPGLDLATIPECEECEAELIGAGSEVVPVRVLWRNVLLERKPQTVIAIRDQRERLRLQALAFRDALTGLANRRRFLDLLAARLASREAGDASVSILMMDLDGFKPVNDRLGHAAGDLVLAEVGTRLVATMQAGDVVARLGGDEFAVLQRAGAGSQTPEALAARILAAIEGAPFLVEGRPVPIGMSIGIAVASRDGSDPGLLMRHADAALYAAKAAGKGRYRRSTHAQEWPGETIPGSELAA